MTLPAQPYADNHGERNRAAAPNAFDKPEAEKSDEVITESNNSEDEEQSSYQVQDGFPEYLSPYTELDRAVSRASSATIGPPPDGGFAAWMSVAAGHLVIMNTWGVVNSFGVFQTYYTTALNRAPSDISWIGSIQAFLLFFVGTFTGRLTDAGYFRSVMIVGMAFAVLGIFATSVSTSYWQIFLAQGVSTGLGNGCLFCPSVAVISSYFQKKRSLAIGIVACGSVTGGLVYPSMMRELLPKIGFGWTVRAIGFLQAATLTIAISCLKARVPPRKTGQLIEWAAFKELEYTFYTIGAFMCFWGVYFPFFFLASYSRDVQGMSYSTSLNLLLLLNGVGVIGRLLPNYFADRFGTINMFIPVAALNGLLMYAWIAVSSTEGLYVWSSMYGMSGGAIQSLFPAALSRLTTDPRKQGTRMGMVFTIVSFSVLTGPPIAGAILSLMGGRYLGGQAFAGSCLVVVAGFLTAAREVKRRKLGEGTLARV
ncbi:major facilitator superfamily transporter [Fusarium albosuccineum]|uniref:Major facilitator superfamily transporter n=1 Tax=Fusarium albosuccineum TaxID=1237068 RepID=A0A8H4KQA1_9HYPO|nr:major facilitator superfamily transporter [Fusarium albosuccineum]